MLQYAKGSFLPSPSLLLLSDGNHPESGQPDKNTCIVPTYKHICPYRIYVRIHTYRYNIICNIKRPLFASLLHLLCFRGILWFRKRLKLLKINVLKTEPLGIPFFVWETRRVSAGPAQPSPRPGGEQKGPWVWLRGLESWQRDRFMEMKPLARPRATWGRRVSFPLLPSEFDTISA